MGLAELQGALAELSTSAAARETFAADPQCFAAAHRLSPAEISQLAAQFPSLRQFARSLRHKRRHEAAAAVPLTVAALAHEFAPTFQTFAERHPAVRDPRLDAMEFLHWLQQQAPLAPPLHALARYERFTLGMHHSNRRLTLRLFLLPAKPAPHLPRLFVELWWRPSARANFQVRRWTLFR